MKDEMLTDGANQARSAMNEIQDSITEALESAEGVLTEPGIMDIDKWKAWRKRALNEIRKALESLRTGEVVVVDGEKLRQYVKCTLTLRNESPKYNDSMYVKAVTDKDIDEELIYLQKEG